MSIHFRGIASGDFSATPFWCPRAVEYEMGEHSGYGRLLVIVGLHFAGIGLVPLFAPSVCWLGRLPGYIRIQRDNFRFYFPTVTCILLSIVLTLALRLFRRLPD